MTAAGSLDEVPLLAGLDPEQRALVAATTRPVVLARGRRLFEEGMPAAGCWVIRRGHVALDAHVPGRGQVVVQTLGPGDVVGWSWLVPPFRWQFGAVAVTDIEALELDTQRLRELAEEHPTLGYSLALAMIEVLLDRLQATRARLLDLYRGADDR